MINVCDDNCVFYLNATELSNPRMAHHTSKYKKVLKTPSNYAKTNKQIKKQHTRKSIRSKSVKGYKPLPVIFIHFQENE